MLIWNLLNTWKEKVSVAFGVNSVEDKQPNEEEKVYDGQSCSKFCNGDTVFSRITPCLENRKIAKESGQVASNT